MTEATIERLSTTASPAAPDPTAEEAQRTLALANSSTAHPPEPRQEGQEQPPAKLPAFQDPRKAIADAARQRRLDDMRGTTEDFNEPALTDPSIAAAQALEQANSGGPVSEGQAQAQAQPAPKQMVKVKIEGREMEVPLEDVVATYQKDKTADVRLQQATELLKSAKNTVTAGAQPPTNADHESDSGQNSPTPTDASARRPTPDDGADVDETAVMDFVEKMMTGSAEEAKEAFKKVVKRPAPQSQTPADIATQVDQQIAIREENKKSAEALEAFGVKLGDAKSDKIIEAAVATIIRDEMVSDLKTAGVPDSFIEQNHLTEPQGMHLLKESHKLLRAAKYPGVRGVNDLLGVVEKNPGFLKLTATSSQPAPQIHVDRGARKEGVQDQPALRTASPPASAQQTRPTTSSDRAKNASSAVDRMRASRGQAAYGA
jgi:hypothetical protein